MKIGNTPMVKIPDTKIYVKLEKYNCGGSVKDRAVQYMVQDLIDKGTIKEDTVLVEATSGNTGIALAMMGSLYHIPVKIIMPTTMSKERSVLLKAYGAEVILVGETMSEAMQYLNELKQANPNYLSLDQFDNEMNVQAHYETTGNEILSQVPDVDAFICCVGSGGTFSGVAKRLKEHRSDIVTIVGEPEKSAVISGQQAGAHGIQGIGAGWVPSILASDLIDDIMLVSKEDAIKEMKQFAMISGHTVGMSSGANIALAKRYAKYHPDAVVVTIAPDGLERYLSVLEIV